MAKKKKKDAYIDPQQRELRELIELKKMQQAAAEHPEEVQAEFEKEEPIVPKTFKEKWKKICTKLNRCNRRKGYLRGEASVLYTKDAR